MHAGQVPAVRPRRRPVRVLHRRAEAQAIRAVRPLQARRRRVPGAEAARECGLGQGRDLGGAGGRLDFCGDGRGRRGGCGEAGW
ncbi:hypothetical protein CCHR01_18190 [Colletotrichum chrysophilum]|uniref:Uncharacterized protein n=1 Tax=Colletotrichum chrysophilum TaxID=1836956 RepID=A0AAD9A0Z9_9PEZI|nr:hypothetical protein CCHR01_18190 [Colletotrichum chrysophilum]